MEPIRVVNKKEIQTKFQHIIVQLATGKGIISKNSFSIVFDNNE